MIRIVDRLHFYVSLNNFKFLMPKSAMLSLYNSNFQKFMVLRVTTVYLFKFYYFEEDYYKQKNIFKILR